MGLFSQPLNRGSSIRPTTPKFSKGLFDHDDVFMLSPVKGSEALSLDCSKAKRYHLPRQFWNIIQNSKGTSIASTSKLQVMSGMDSGTDMSPVDEWDNENDHVNLLPHGTSTTVRSAIYPSKIYPSNMYPRKGKEYLVKATSLPVSTTAGFPLRKHTSEVLTTNGNGSHKNRSCSTKSVMSCNKSKKSRKEIEIQFECFLEDEEDFHVPSFATSPMAEKFLTKSTVTTSTKSVQSWLAERLGALKKGCMIPANLKLRKSSQPRERNVTEFSGDCDAESQAQIVFDVTNICDCTDEYMFSGSHSVEDDFTISFSHSQVWMNDNHNQLWENEAPIQFAIPNNAINIKKAYPRDCNDDRLLIYDDFPGEMNVSKHVLVSVV